MIASRHSLASLWLALACAAGCRGAGGSLAPRCVSPAPLLGKFDPAAPGYIVLFRDQVDPVAETQRLATRYSFTPRYVYTAALKGFAADLQPPVAAALQCEPSVASLEYDAAGHVAG
jgi:hypothetical protein